ncbi:MAG: undecaprenyldiphospho-muramoylpentapeptide beta-N-acetylglucosaminyltransferase [Pseudomonadota bacterium]
MALESEKSLKVVIAGGGTGGHIFPGVAVGREIQNRFKDAKVIFVSGKRKMESEIFDRYGFDQRRISVEGIKGRGWIKGIKVLSMLPYSFFQSISILKKFLPHLVLGVGGYSAGPVCLAGKVMGIPTAIHEQNSFPGFTNRLLCRIVDRVFISFEESREYFPCGVIYLTGNPLRQELLTDNNNGERVSDRFTILVVGGSQGARTVNRTFLEALDILRKEGREPCVIHQTGQTDYYHVVKEYENRGLKGKILSFIQDMGAAYHQADVVVGRAGATTISELAALGKPSILIPYPFAANDHQVTNALMLVNAGGAEIILQKNLNAQILAGVLRKYMEDRGALNKMGQLAKSVGKKDAVDKIVDQLMMMIRRD